MIDQYLSTDKKATRDGFGAGLYEIGNENDQVVCMNSYHPETGNFSVSKIIRNVYIFIK